MSPAQYDKGDIVVFQLGGLNSQGQTQPPLRAVVLSSASANVHLETLIVCPLVEAGTISKSRLGATFVPAQVAGSTHDALALTLQIHTLSKRHIVKRLGSLSKTLTSHIDKSLVLILGLEPRKSPESSDAPLSPNNSRDPETN